MARRPCAPTLLATRPAPRGALAFLAAAAERIMLGLPRRDPGLGGRRQGVQQMAEADLGQGKKQGRGAAGLQDEAVRVDEHRGLREQIRVKVRVAFLVEDGAGGVREHV